MTKVRHAQQGRMRSSSSLVAGWRGKVSWIALILLLNAIIYSAVTGGLGMMAGDKEPCAVVVPSAGNLSSNNENNNITSSSIETSSFEVQNATVLILTPLKSSGHHLPDYFQRVQNLTYPKHLISFGFLEGDGGKHDNTYSVLQQELRNLSSSYRRAVVAAGKDFSSRGRTAEKAHQRHGLDLQEERRSRIARARNYLLNFALTDEDHVLWLDVDVIGIPSDLIEMLIGARKPIVVANCMYVGSRRAYDLNSWAETTASRQYVRKQPPDRLLVEGYRGIRTGRRSLNDLRNGTTDRSVVVPLEGVGGTALLVNGDVHRNGVMFPPWVIQNAIETEGLCRVAERVGYGCFGMPNLEVWHR